MSDVQERFLDIYVQCEYHVTNACRLIGIDRSTFYKWKKDSESFKSKFDKIEDERRDIIVEKAEHNLQKLVEGVAKYDSNGKFIKWIVQPDREAIKFALTKLAKDKYGDVSEQNINIKGSIPIEKWIQRDKN